MKVSGQRPFISDKSLEARTDYTIEIWNSENGLPQNTIVSICQTHDGFLWMSTTNGLVRFDGNTFNVYDSSNTMGFQGSCFPTLFEDRKGKLWLINQEGKLLIYERGVFEMRSIKPNENVIITSICENEKGECLVSTYDNKVYLFVNDQFRLLFILPDKTNRINKIECSEEGLLYIGTQKGLFKYEANNLSEVEELKGMQISQLKRCKNVGVCVREKNRLFRIRKGKTNEYQFPDTLSTDLGLRDFLFESENRLWVAYRNGLALIEHNSCRFYDTNSGLSSDLTTVIYKDMENNMWTGTAGGGLNKMKLKAFNHYSKKEGLANDPVGCILQLQDKSMLISNECEGLNKLDHEKITTPFKKHFGCIWSLFEEKNGDLWIGTYGQGIFRYKDGNFSQYTTDNNLSGNIVFAVFQDNTGLIWIGTDNGLCTFKNG
ncbi:MAG TPA: two-component regulator propeller domain-containing protein, partial [Nitrosopumilaceae archaeon]|nr:two-component regulator propeller domain-containing protein [Nitrosopumilaceae archaeon]